MTETLVERMTDTSATAKMAEASYQAGFAAQRRGDYSLARSLYQRVLDRQPAHAGALHWLGVLDYLDGQLEAALKNITAAIASGPATSEMLDNLGTVLEHLGQNDESLSAYRRAVELDPHSVHAIVNLASSLTRLNQFEVAGALARKALELRPGHAGAHNVLGHQALRQKQPAQALGHFQKTADAAPQDAEAHYNLGVTHYDLHQPGPALEAYDRALALNAAPAKYYTNRGATLLRLMRVPEAAASYRQALARDNGLAEAHYNLAICLFLLGDYRAGGAEYEWRLRLPVTAGDLSRARADDTPLWTGAPDPDKTLLLLHEQGLGDSVQFIRLAQRAAKRVGRVLVEVQPRLKPLFRSLPGIEVFAAGEAIPQHDFHASLMSLIHLLDVTVEQLPASSIPYLAVEPERLAKWRVIMSVKPGVRIGIRWQGNPKAKVDRNRSMPLAMLAPIAAVPGVRLITLQKDDGAEQMHDPALGFTVENIEDGDKSGSADTLLDTAAIISNLDLIITTDTMIAHLAGALGKPAWVMLKPDADWRWLLERSDSPWYPSLRLYRASFESGWPEVIARIANDLASHIKKRPAVSSAVSHVNTRLAEAVKLHQAGRTEAAQAAYDEILLVDPVNAVALHYSGVIHYQRNELDLAENLIRQALAVQPENAEIHANLALVLKHQGQLDEAVAACHRALDLNPNYAEAESNLGNALATLGRYGDALPHYQAAVRLKPDNAAFHNNYGTALSELSRLDTAADEFRTAIALVPQNPDYHFNLAEALLADGQWAMGWHEYEWRRKTTSYGQITQLPQPEWDGRPAPDKTLLLHAEQGLGDTFQFLRFVERARPLLGRVMLVVQPGLKSLAATAPGVDAVYTYGEAMPPFDLKAPLPSLPHLLRLENDAGVGMTTPYLGFDAAEAEKWRVKLGAGFKVGLNWQGNPQARADKGRSLPLIELAPLAEVDNVRLIRIQRGAGAAQVAQLPPAFRIETPVGDEIGPDTFAADAALIAALDLVITTDTSVAHLAGALGKPVWLMLKAAPDWRWQRGRTDTPWYPTLRLFRQSAAGDWAGVVQAVKAALAELAAAQPVVEVKATVPPAPELSPVPDKTLELALAAHQAGRLPEAIALYDEALTRHPDDPAALHYKGVALYQEGHAGRGETFIRRSLQLKPDYLEAVGNLGLTLKAQGKLDEAIDTYRHALELHPDYAEAHNNLGNLLAGQKKFDAALKHHQAAAHLQPQRAENHANLGNTLGDLERSAEAALAFEAALALAPKNLNALNGLGKALRMSERLPEAEQAYRRALAIESGKPDGWSNLGVILREQGRYDEALQCYREALTRNPDHAETWGNLAFALHHLGRVEEAEDAYRRVLKTRPDHAEAHFGIAAALLTRGNFAEGWPEYRWRKGLKDFGPGRALAAPEWDGRPAIGKTLFLYAEQGLGDTIQWARFLPMAAKKVGALVVEVQKSLTQIIAQVEGVATVIAQGAALPPHDLQCALMDLPGLLGVMLDNLPAAVPYLQVEPLREQLWAQRLAEKPGLRVGLNWQGNPQGAIDKGRSLPLARLAALAKVPDIRLISLQKTEAAEQVRNCGFAVEQLEDAYSFGPGPFSDSAALINNLDLVITTDTSIAHLAGALGRPVWVMLKADCDWRWMLGRDDSPWYPTMQLFRQPKMGEWDKVIERVAAELLKIVS